MSSYKNQNNTNIISSENPRVLKSSSNPIRKGFNSTNQSQLIDGKPLQLSQPPTSQKYAKKFLRQGLDKFDQGDYSGALEDLKQASRFDPNFSEAYVCQSIIRYYQGDHQGAIADCNQVLQISPRSAEAYNNRGLNRSVLGDHQGAIADFNQALEIEPNYTKAYLNRGYSRLQLDENWGAIEDFDQALRIDPQATKAYLQQINNTLNDEQGVIKDVNQQLAQGFLIQGNLRYQSGDYQAAIQAYTQVLHLEPNNGEAYNRRSTARSAVGDYEGAFEDLYKAACYYLGDEQSLELLPMPTVEDYHYRAMDKLQKEDFHGAIEDFNQLLQLNGDNATAFAYRGCAYRRLGYNQKAIEDLQIAAELFSEQGDVTSSNHILNSLKKLQQN